MIHTARAGGYRGGRSYLLIDHRAAPEGTLLEADTLTCAHCQVVVVLNPARTRDRAHCVRCSRYICDKPACALDCNYTEEMIDLALADPAGGPYLLRGPNGEVLYDTRKRDARRIH